MGRLTTMLMAAVLSCPMAADALLVGWLLRPPPRASPVLPGLPVAPRLLTTEEPLGRPHPGASTANPEPWEADVGPIVAYTGCMTDQGQRLADSTEITAHAASQLADGLCGGALDALRRRYSPEGIAAVRQDTRDRIAGEVMVRRVTRMPPPSAGPRLPRT